MNIRRYPLLPFALSAVAGTMVGLFFDMQIEVWTIVCAILTLLSVAGLMRAWKVPARLLILLLLTITVCAWRGSASLARHERREWNQWSMAADSIQIVGSVQLGEASDIARGRLRVSTSEISTDSATWRAFTAILEIKTDSVTNLLPGDIIIASGLPECDRKILTRSVASLSWRISSRVIGTLRCDSCEIALVKRPALSVPRWAFRARAYVAEQFTAALQRDAAAICTALLLGDQSDFSPEFVGRLQATGLSHIFALSGMNTGLLVSLVWLITGLLFVPRRTRHTVCMAFTAGFLVIGLSSPSLVRASLMTEIYLLSRLLSRPVGIVNLVSAAAFIELLWSPLHLLSPGFQLSYLSVAGITSSYLWLRAAALKIAPALFHPFSSAFTEAGLLTLGSQIGTLPALAVLFGRVPFLGAAANIVAVPVFALILISSVVFLVLNAVFPPLAEPLATALELLTAFVSRLVHWLSEVPMAGLSIAAPAWVLMFVGYAGLAAIVFGLMRKRISLLIIGLLLVANLVAWYPLRVDSRRSEIVFFDVQNGDAALIQTAGRFVVLDDGPRLRDWTFARAMASEVRSRGGERIDLLILTHPDNDHIGGTAELLSEMDVLSVLVSGDSAESRIYFEYDLAMKSSGRVPDTALAGQEIKLGPNAQISILAPWANMKYGEYSENQRSIVIRLDIGESSALFTADIDSTIEHLLSDARADLDVDLLKIPHHGSKSSSCSRFLHLTAPEIAVISAGARNIYGHPSPDVIGRLDALRIKTVITGLSGTVTVRAEDGTWQVLPGRAEWWARRFQLM